MTVPDNYFSLLPTLGTAIDASLSEWESYLKRLDANISYELISSNDTKAPATKLVRSYNNPELEAIRLSELCSNLLDELQSPETEVELGAWFSRVLWSKRFLSGVMQLEKDIKDREQGRLQEPRKLKASQSMLTTVREDCELGWPEVEALLEAMEAVGVSLTDCGIVKELAEPDEVCEDSTAVGGQQK
ncbi:hypothetical protein LTR37_000384 [Vermiconidia calcicola]|uniref:Uncharacterized protein n=1 Tax=Vermiconidia calcicola TaxID=1690605 RepID=A0ACC3NY50_9PEZI|nr:hypothetical protein LTR37_000384 [Vermiconidia calcicola]